MAFRTRWTRLVSGVALAATAGLAAAACTSHGPVAGSTSGAAVPPVTTAEATRAFAAYLAGTATAAGVGNETKILAHVTDVQAKIASVGYLAATYYHLPPPANRIQYGRPVFYLPETTGYPQWFVADAGTTYAGQKAPAGTVVKGTPAGIQWVGANGRSLMLFKKASATDGWQLSSTLLVAPGSPVPALKADAGGHVPVVSLSDSALLARPDVAGALQAAVVDEGPASAASKVVAGGALTTGIYHNEQAGLLALSAPRGDVLRWELDGSSYPRLALRTADGGALVFYAMFLDTTVQTPASLAQSPTPRPGPPIKVPFNLAPLLAHGQPAPRNKLEGQQLLSFAAVDPPAGGGKIQVIAIGGDWIYAWAS